MITRMDLLLEKAKKEKYGIAAPCPLDYEQVKWCFEVAEELKAPIILCYHAWKNKGMSIEEFSKAVHYYEAKHKNVPVAFCLDHGRSYEDAVRAINVGFTGVMVDRSDLPDKDNAQTILDAIKMAHTANVSVEAALGGALTRDASLKQREDTLTNLQSSIEFCKSTGIDALAVAVGSYHGDIKADAAVLHFDLIKDLHEQLPCSLVMHGCSFLGDENLKKSAECGIQKFNVQGELLNAGMQAAKKYLSKEAGDVAELNAEIKAGYIAQLKNFMTQIGCVNRY